MKKYCSLLVASIAVVLSACIKNDIPYPHIQANFITLEAEGQDQGTQIDSIACTATIHFPEEVDIYNVVIKDYTITPDAEIVDNPFAKPIDLSVPREVVLRLYQEYTWQIIGRQEIERYFEVEGQIGATVIDVAARTVEVSIPETQDINAVKVLKSKLGPKGSVMTPDLSDGGIFDGSQPFEINVAAYGRSEAWTVYVSTVEAKVRTTGVDAWTAVAWVHGMGEAGKEFGVQYRIADSDEWTDVPTADITVNSGDFTARIIHLSPNTAYQARAVSEGYYGEILGFTTGDDPQMPNSNFDNWWLDKKIWCPWLEGGTPYWGTGNKGATTLGDSNTTPTTDTPSGTGWAAKLETRFVGIGMLGKLAAGNIFAGDYVRTVGTNGVLAFGRPYTDRPTKLRGQFKYTVADISHSSSDFKHLIGQPDTCIVWVALIDSDEPFEIRTEPKNRHLFDPDGDYVIAYGKLECAQTISEYVPFEFELDYKSTSRKPKYLLVTASASKYGDYFTGGNGSTLYLDDFELIYDY